MNLAESGGRGQGNPVTDPESAGPGVRRWPGRAPQRGCRPLSRIAILPVSTRSSRT